MCNFSACPLMTCVPIHTLLSMAVFMQIDVCTVHLLSEMQLYKCVHQFTLTRTGPRLSVTNIDYLFVLYRRVGSGLMFGRCGDLVAVFISNLASFFFLFSFLNFNFLRGWNVIAVKTFQVKWGFRCIEHGYIPIGVSQLSIIASSVLCQVVFFVESV